MPDKTAVHLFLSPHFDDAVYSCGGTLATLTGEGKPVYVVTIMAGEQPDPLPDTAIVRDLHQRWQGGEDPIATRRTEDHKAVTTLGAHLVHLPLPDCVYRTAQGHALYPSEESLWHIVHVDDPAPRYLEALPISQLLSHGSTVARLYAPLAAGDHVDHLIVRDWAYRLAATHPELELWFYADFPYTRSGDAIDKALQAHQREGHELKAVTFAFDEAALKARIAAMQQYHTQISTFWPDAAAIDPEVRAAFRHDGGFGERYWQFQR